MKTSVVFVALLAIASARHTFSSPKWFPITRYIDVPAFPEYTAQEWEEVMANQEIPAVDDLDNAPRGTEEQPESSGRAVAPPEGHIVNGQEAYPGQFPWQAAIFLDGKSFCGGSLITDKIILTAGHCVDSVKLFVVTMGAQNIRQKEQTQVVQETTNAVLHQKYDATNIKNDIALITVPAPFPLNDRIRTIALPTKSMVSDSLEGRTLTVSGFGRRDQSMSISPVLNYVALPVMPNKECAKYFGKHILSTNVCGSGEHNRSSCNGDSGGPFTLNQDNKEIVVGIVSFGSSKGCDIGYPSVYTRVTAYLGWIQANTGITIKP